MSRSSTIPGAEAQLRLPMPEGIAWPGEDERVRVARAPAPAGTPAWKVHDRTHLELGLAYELAEGEATGSFEWEAFFFVPASLRLDPSTYGEQDMYAYLRSYVRPAVPESCEFAREGGECNDG